MMPRKKEVAVGAITGMIRIGNHDGSCEGAKGTRVRMRVKMRADDLRQTIRKVAKENDGIGVASGSEIRTKLEYRKLDRS